jgi:hypothetical protein
VYSSDLFLVFLFMNSCLLINFAFLLHNLAQKAQDFDVRRSGEENSISRHLNSRVLSSTPTDVRRRAKQAQQFNLTALEAGEKLVKQKAQKARKAHNKRVKEGNGEEFQDRRHRLPDATSLKKAEKAAKEQEKKARGSREKRIRDEEVEVSKGDGVFHEVGRTVGVRGG